MAWAPSWRNGQRNSRGNDRSRPAFLRTTPRTHSPPDCAPTLAAPSACDRGGGPVAWAPSWRNGQRNSRGSDRSRPGPFLGKRPTSIQRVSDRACATAPRCLPTQGPFNSAVRPVGRASDHITLAGVVICHEIRSVLPRVPGWKRWPETYPEVIANPREATFESVL